MKTRLSILALIVLLAACTTASPPAQLQQQLSGVINKDLTLGGEILLNGDLLILPGKTLTLLPGTIVHVRTAESSKIDPEYLSSFTEILVRGTLLAEGTVSAPIVFVPETPGDVDEVVWAGIILDRVAASVIRHARIEGAEQGILLLAAAAQISENTIRHCRYGLVVQGEGSPTLYGNEIDAGEGGLFVLAGATPDIDRNRITAQVEEGLFVDAASRPHLGRNEISGNAIGLLLHHRDLPFERSGISGNREDLRIIGGE